MKKVDVQRAVCHAHGGCSEKSGLKKFSIFVRMARDHFRLAKHKHADNNNYDRQ
jgi:hypothetical protein